jgi:hypothetical protein
MGNQGDDQLLPRQMPMTSAGEAIASSPGYERDYSARWALLEREYWEK